MNTSLIDKLQSIRTFRTLSQGENISIENNQCTIRELAQLPFRTLVELGFGNWDGTLILLPEWVYPYVADGEVLTCITGETMVKGQDYIDQDTRGGWLAFGFKGPVDVL